MNSLFAGTTIKVRAIHVVNESTKRKLYLDCGILPSALIPTDGEGIMLPPGGMIYVSHPGKKIEISMKALEEAINKPKSSVNVTF